MTALNPKVPRISGVVSSPQAFTVCTGTTLPQQLPYIYEEGLVIGWSTSIGYNGEVLAIPKDRHEN
jgi:hypothetical protein